MNHRPLLLLCLILLLTGCVANKAKFEPNVIPRPQLADYSDKKVSFSKANLNLPSQQAENRYAAWLKDNGVGVVEEGGLPVSATITDSIAGAPANDEAYSLSVAPEGISIEAVSPKGIMLALQTLRQLEEKDRQGEMVLPVCSITDWAAFPWRGFLMDVGRSYISMDELKREMDAMELFKLNVFHFHFTENQAWRVESKAYPQLTDSSVIERQPGLYYTLSDVRELADYAAERGILFVPEIDMPGHSAAFERAFGTDMQSARGKEILKELVGEFCDSFPDLPYLHIGTDEVAFTDPDFVPKMVAFVRSKGKKAISWNPGWNYAPGEIDMTQLWSYRGKAQPGIPAIDSRLHYLNHFDTYADLVALYRSQIYHHTEGTPDIAGGEIAVWNDRYTANERDNIGSNSVYPAILAFAERTWLGGGKEYFDSLGTNLGDPDSEDFREFADFERRLLHHKATSLADVPIPYVAQTPVEWRITEAFPNGGDLTAVFPPEKEGMKESYVFGDSTFTTSLARGAGIYLRHVWGNTVPTFYSAPQPDHTAYAFTRVYSPKDQTVGLQAETQNYSRSEPDLAPPAGKWDYRESRIYVNGEEVAPPVWTATHTERSNEISLGNENLSSRAPIPVKLHKGWNDVMIKLPVGAFSTRDTRLVKWMFTFVFTTPDGRDAAPGLKYSASID